MNKVVKRLLLQYNEYCDLLRIIDSLNRDLVLAKINKKLVQVKSLEKEIKICNNQLNRISDEMSFKDPITWIRYKYYAYKGTSSDISTLSDLVNHCLPESYICTKRFKYLSRYFDFSKIKGDTNLIKMISNKKLKMLNKNYDFMIGWQKYEYNIKSGIISKWKNFK